MTLTGTAVPFATVDLFLRKQGTTPFLDLRDLTADENGDFSTNFVGNVNYEYYASSDGVSSEKSITEVTGMTITAPGAARRGAAVTLRAEALLVSGPLVAPHLMPVEAANVLRRLASAGDISADVAALAHEDLVSLRLEPFPYSACASRIWELRSNITAYDAWYVALAETLGARLATLDVRLSRATGTRCEFAVPPT